MTPVMTMARGMSRSGFRISSAIVDASSMPMKAKHITPRPLAMSSAEPATSGGVAATPCRRATAAATTSKHDGGGTADAADVVDPLADAHAAHVGDGDDRQPPEGDRRDEPSVVHQRRRCVAAGKRDDTREIDQQHRDVEQVVGPVAPAGDESVNVAEVPASPQSTRRLRRDIGATTPARRSPSGTKNAANASPHSASVARPNPATGGTVLTLTMATVPSRTRSVSPSVRGIRGRRH